MEAAWLVVRWRRDWGVPERASGIPWARGNWTRFETEVAGQIIRHLRRGVGTHAAFFKDGNYAQRLQPSERVHWQIWRRSRKGRGPTSGGGECSIAKRSCFLGLAISSYSGEHRLRLEPMNSQPSPFQIPPPKQSIYWQKALIWQSLGFLIMVVLTWSDAIFDLAHVILGLPHREVDINRTAIITVVIVLLWMFSGYKIYLVVSRLSYLESFLHVCAWCRKIEHNAQWLSLEAHFAQKTGGKVSHGICPECAEKVTREGREGAASTGR